MTEKNMTTSNENTVSREATRSGARYLAPPVDIFETEDERSVEISVDQGVLTVEGTAPFGTGELLWREYAMDGYWRQFQLTDTFDVTKAKAEVRHGVLTLQLPKAEAAKPRKITIETRQ